VNLIYVRKKAKVFVQGPGFLAAKIEFLAAKQFSGLFSREEILVRTEKKIRAWYNPIKCSFANAEPAVYTVSGVFLTVQQAPPVHSLNRGGLWVREGKSFCARTRVAGASGQLLSGICIYRPDLRTQNSGCWAVHCCS
jgi:hypothetical protein